VFVFSWVFVMPKLTGTKDHGDWPVYDHDWNYAESTVSGAPSEARIVKVDVSFWIEDVYVSDIYAELIAPDNSYQVVWNRWGSRTDDGWDDDNSNDDDIQVYDWTISSTFDGKNPNGDWILYVED